MGDNKLFMLYLKYMMTRLNMEEHSKVFCLLIKNTEEEVARSYEAPDSEVVLCEHRSFTVSVIRNGQRIRNLTKRFLATDADSEATLFENCFPDADGFYHYRDDFDFNFFIANVSNFNFNARVEEASQRLLMRSESVQKRDVVGTDDADINPFRSSNRAYQTKRRNEEDVNESNTAPAAVPKSDSDSDKEAKMQSEDGFYYQDVAHILPHWSTCT